VDICLADLALLLLLLLLLTDVLDRPAEAGRAGQGSGSESVDDHYAPAIAQVQRSVVVLAWALPCGSLWLVLGMQSVTGTSAVTCGKCHNNVIPLLR
jgi:hypothetical protein